MSLFPAPWGNYLLKELAETDTPETISWLPQTIGWQLLLLLLLVMFAHKAYKALKRYQHDIYRRNALSWLSRLPEYNASSPDNIYRQLPSLLRKVSLYAYNRQEVCLLSHSAWEQWLDEQCTLTNFSGENAELLYQLAYKPNYQIDVQQMQRLRSDISTWIQHHRGSL